jgi:hypothetical protein
MYHGREPVQVAEIDRIVEAELGPKRGAEKGSPGASARTTNRTSEMPSRLGTAIRRRRRTY